MIQIYSIKDSNKWDEVVTSFADYDVYYMSGYARSFFVHGDGEPHLLYYTSEKLRAMYVYMKRKTAIDGIYDSITPYGYGGVLFDGEVNDINLLAFRDEFLQTMQNENIISDFVRYHPVLGNAVSMKSISQVIDLGNTIAMDLTSPEIIWENITSKNRNTIRKAQKNNIQIHHTDDYSIFQSFISIYNETMDRDNADEYYYFKEDFYKVIYDYLKGNFQVFYATLDDKIVAASLILYANKQVHYHLSGSLSEYRHLAPTNLLLYQVALWGCENGFKTLHLGGGLGSGNDNLYKFKAAFNRNSGLQFSIGKQIFNQELYDKLVDLRLQKDPNFNVESKFFPLYRDK